MMRRKDNAKRQGEILPAAAVNVFGSAGLAYLQLIFCLHSSWASDDMMVGTMMVGDWLV